MSDAIDRQAAIDEIKEPMMLEYVWAYSCKEEEEAISVLVETICQQTKSTIADRLERLKSADVVEVVRCKDCTIRYTACPMVVRNRGMFSFFMEDNDFCSRAKGDSDGRFNKQTGGDRCGIKKVDTQRKDESFAYVVNGRS